MNVADLKIISAKAKMNGKFIVFTFKFSDEKTIQYFESRYTKSKITTDGRIFTMQFFTNMGFNKSEHPELWHAMKNDEAMIKAYVLARVRGH